MLLARSMTESVVLLVGTVVVIGAVVQPSGGVWTNVLKTCPAWSTDLNNNWFGPVQKYWSRLSARTSGTELAAEIEPRSVSTSGAIVCCINTMTNQGS